MFYEAKTIYFEGTTMIYRSECDSDELGMLTAMILCTVYDNDVSVHALY